MGAYIQVHTVLLLEAFDRESSRSGLGTACFAGNIFRKVEELCAKYGFMVHVCDNNLACLSQITAVKFKRSIYNLLS